MSVRMRLREHEAAIVAAIMGEKNFVFTPNDSKSTKRQRVPDVCAQVIQDLRARESIVGINWCFNNFSIESKCMSALCKSIEFTITTYDYEVKVVINRDEEVVGYIYDENNISVKSMSDVDLDISCDDIDNLIIKPTDPKDSLVSLDATLDPLSDKMYLGSEIIIDKKDIQLLEGLKSKFSDAELKLLSKGNGLGVKGLSVPYVFEGERIRFLAVTDTHLGSKYTNDEFLFAAFDEAMRQGCEFLTHSGDVCEGVSNRPDHFYECTHFGYAAQKEHAIDVLSDWKLPAYCIAGNHDGWFKKSAGAEIVADICSQLNNWTYLGYGEGNIDINGAIIKLWHGEDGSSYAHSHRLQKLIESFTGGEKPNVLIAGHVHKAFSMIDRNVFAVSAGCMQRQSTWMRQKRLPAHVGFYIIDMVVKNGEVKSFCPTFYPAYK